LVALFLARPSPPLYIAGLAVAAMGEGIRIWAAGHLIKGRGLTRSGPYSWTRNPLYLGSCLIGLGFSLATGRWQILIALVLLLVGVFLPVMRAEARELSVRQPEAYGEYAKAVPLLFPGPRAGTNWAKERRFSWKRVLANREHLALLGWAAVALLLWWKMSWSG
jgi:hypothetical protein